MMCTRRGAFWRLAPWASQPSARRRPVADEVAGLLATLTARQEFLVHDINFHRAVAAASGNPIVASLVEMVSALYYERRRVTAERAADRDLRDAAAAHRRIYQAVRAHDVD